MVGSSGQQALMVTESLWRSHGNGLVTADQELDGGWWNFLNK